ncbi:hypothetical protein KP509_32G028300 [Ceratopteris richardii]|uniref:K Homology domain-containing protein n=1 Tax=Ceratopteris richardii TaxID=49495 RepID=A0A8T2QTM1_CERRI|nr:hypothetical protein KP509_32G028300 [Ceratopteris richardii]
MHMDGSMRYGFAGKRSHQGDDGGERNEKQKKRSGRNDETTMPAPEEVEYRILCPLEKAGGVIGKGGSIIKAIRIECKSKIKVEELVTGSEERVVVISSSPDQKPGSQYVCAAQEALFRAYARITERSEDDEDGYGQITARLLVPKNHIGCILGKGGKIIEQMRKDIGAQIRILPKEQLPTCAEETDELVQIVGDDLTVRRALFAISTRLHDNVTGERANNAGYMSQGTGSAIPAFQSGDTLYPSSGYLGSSASFFGPSSYGSGLSGHGYSYSSYGGAYGDLGMRPLNSGLTDRAAPGGMSGYGRTDGTSEEQLMVRMLCPKNRIGSVIGKGGSIIKKMREETGAKIKVEEELPDCDERIIQISSAEFGEGPSQAIQAAIVIYQRLVELQLDKERDNHSFVVRLLVPSSQIGCLLGKGGSIVTEMRKITKANIRISPKDEPSKCAEQDDEIVQNDGVEEDLLFLPDSPSHMLDCFRCSSMQQYDGISRKSSPSFLASLVIVICKIIELTRSGMDDVYRDVISLSNPSMVLEILY